MNKFFFALLLFSFSLNTYSQTVDFTFSTSNNLFCSPASVLFTQNCTGNPTSFVWDFGNNTYGDQASQNVSYTAGTYKVKLVAIFGNISQTITKTIVINAAGTAGITADRNYICQPGAINFVGSGGGNITQYEWDFGDLTGITDVTTPAISHSYSSLSTNTVKLTTTNDQGCKGVATTSIVIKSLPIIGTESKNQGCIPATVSFSSAVTVPATSSVISYTWDYGDGTAPVTTTVSNSSHSYTVVGQYLPTLVATTNEGCSNTFNYGRVNFGIPPSNLTASAQNNPICGSEIAQFNASATNANAYYWTFNDGTPSVIVTGNTVSHKFNTVGLKTVSVIPYYYGCTIAPPAVASKIVTLTVRGVIAKYAYNNDCTNKITQDTYTLKDTSSGIPTSYLWSFSDNPIQQSGATTVHTFPSSGQFSVQLLVNDATTGCADSITKLFYTAVPIIFSSDSSVCKNSIVNFSMQQSFTNPASQYTWNVLGIKVGPTTAQVINVKAGQLGTFNNFVLINNGVGNCIDTVYADKPFLVRGPKIAFSGAAAICFQTLDTLTNNTQPFVPKESISLTYWNYGISKFNDSVYQPKPIAYSNAGMYNIKLVAIDVNGCRDSLIKPVNIVAIPILHILSVTNFLCYGNTDSLIAFHNNKLQWSPAAGLSCTTCDTTIATPLINTKYFATASNAFGCSVKDSILLQVSIPFKAIINPIDTAICELQNIGVKVQPSGKKITWSPATGLSNTSIYNPVITGLASTVYTVTLSDSAGCLTNSDTAHLRLIIKSLPTVSAGQFQSYPKGANFSFSPTYSSNVAYYLWTPSDLLNCNNCAIPTGIADRTQLYTIQVTSDSGCIASDSVTIAIQCKYAYLFMPKAFTPNNDNLNDLFYPETFGVKTITKFAVFNRSGQLIYEATNFSPNDKNFGWDGTFKGSPQPAGSYVYFMEALCDIGEKLFKKDTVILLR